MRNSNNSVLQVRTPLFNRLIDQEPEYESETYVDNTLTLNELRESIRDEISMLLNTRESKIPFSFNDTRQYDSRTQLSNAYGLPDFSYFEEEKTVSIARMAAHLANIISKYEPRLTEVRVHALTHDDTKQCLSLEVSGEIVVDEYIEKYNFPVIIEDVHTQNNNI